CYSCHGALRQKAELRLDTAHLLRKGGRHGPAVVAGKADESLLIDAVTGNSRPRMPPEAGGAPLTAHQGALLKAWIDQGARAPQEATPEDPRDHWAFRAPVRPPVPLERGRPAHLGAGGTPALPANPIDTFLAAEHDKHGLQPRPPAGKEVLLR